ncbi:MAG: hypothetical protein U5K69_27395 [Balneolaceae bacterium]|nr:hypothetical protein [Balneolaceae bacterium]
MYLIPMIPVELAPQTDADEIDVDFEMAEGTNIAVQNEYLKELEKVVRANLSDGRCRAHDNGSTGWPC